MLTAGATADAGAGRPSAASSSFLTRDLDVVAQLWHGASSRAGSSISSNEIPTPEALAVLAAKRGVDLPYQQRSVSSLSAADFPCIVLRKDRSTSLLTGFAEGGFACLSGGHPSVIGKSELCAVDAGIIFFPRPQVPTLSEDGDGESHVFSAHEVEKPTGALKMFASLIWRHHRRRMLQLVVAALIGNVLLLALPLYSMAVYDRVIPHLAMETLTALTIGVLIALFADLAIRSVKARVLDAIAYSVSTAIQARFFNRLLHIQLSSAPRSAAAMTNGVRDIENLCMAAPAVLVSLVVDLPFLLIVFGLVAGLGGWVSLVPVFGISVLVAVYMIAHSVSHAEALKRTDLVRTQANLLNETIDGLESVKVMAAEGALLRRWERLSDATAFSGHRSRIWNSFASQSGISLGQFVIVLAMFVAVLEISNGLLTMGALAATSLLVGRMLAPVTQLVATGHSMSMLLKTLDGIDAVLKAPVERPGDPTRSADLKGDIEFRDVSFSYQEAREGGLHNVSLAIRPGERVALIGRIGCGKSTLLKLMLRLHNPNTGTVLLDGYDIRQHDPGAIRRTMGMMSQQHALFNDSLQNNLMFGLENVTASAFEKAVTIAGVKDVAARQANGYAVQVGARGERLSGGERQLVALARTLMGDPSVLILDEPTASMDNALEARIIRDLKTHLGDRTLIVATHRAAVLDLVDRVIWIDNGRIVADGPKNEVLNRLKRSAA